MREDIEFSFGTESVNDYSDLRYNVEKAFGMLKIHDGPKVTVHDRWNQRACYSGYRRVYGI